MSKFIKTVDESGFSYLARESNPYHGISDQEAADIINDLYEALELLHQHAQLYMKVASNVTDVVESAIAKANGE